MEPPEKADERDGVIDVVSINDGYEQLANAVVAQGIEDYLMLEAYGIVECGEVVKAWPQTPEGNDRRFGGIRSDSQAEEVVDFVTGSRLDWWLQMTTVNHLISAERIRYNLGIRMIEE